MTVMPALWVPETDQTSTPDNTYRWATVTQLSPLRIRLDGDTAELPLTPETLIAPSMMVAGSRVWVQLFGRRLLVTGVAGGGDTGWSNLTITDTTNFGLYQASEPLRIRKIGNRVYLKGGVLSKTAAYIDTTTGRQFATIPVGYRPTPVASGTDGSEPAFVCQASNVDRYELRVFSSDGRVTAGRHGAGASGANTWLNVNAHWLTD